MALSWILSYNANKGKWIFRRQSRRLESPDDQGYEQFRGLGNRHQSQRHQPGLFDEDRLSSFCRSVNDYRSFIPTHCDHCCGIFCPAKTKGAGWFTPAESAGRGISSWGDPRQQVTAFSWKCPAKSPAWHGRSAMLRALHGEKN